jgi:hypothetical protein
MNNMREDVEDAMNISIMIDLSNYRDTKLFPFWYITLSQSKE